MPSFQMKPFLTVFNRVLLRGKGKSPILNGFHINQTAYQKNVSCIDATHESVAQYLRDGDRVFACFYDLEKAFDSVEHSHSVLLYHLYTAGIRGKCQCLTCRWYSSPSGHM